MVVRVLAVGGCGGGWGWGGGICEGVGRWWWWWLVQGVVTTGCVPAMPRFARDTHRPFQAISRVIKHSEGGDGAWQNKQSL